LDLYPMPVRQPHCCSVTCTQAVHRHPRYGERAPSTLLGGCVGCLCPVWESRENRGKTLGSRGMRSRGERASDEARERHPHGIRYPALCTCSYARAQHTTATARLGSPHVVQFQLLAASWSSRAKSAIQPRTWAISNVPSEGETPTCVAAVRE
jgi:hypothetical protein